MDTSHHTMRELLQQIGLRSDARSLDEFVSTHELTAGTSLADARFWSPSQAEFLREALDDDSDWSEAADELATLLSRRATQRPRS